MNDPNTTRHHYRKTSELLARRRKISESLAWLALWLAVAVVGYLLSL